MPSTVNGTPAGTTGDDTFNGTTGNDVINMISTGTGADGGTGHDVAFGGAGNDRIISDGGDIIYGGQGGVDIADLRLQDSTVNFVIDLSDELSFTDVAATNRLYDIGDHKTMLSSIEQLFFYGGSGNDSIVGGAYADRIDGGGGANSIYGGGGADQIFGHNGDVTLDGGAGADVITIDGYVAHVNGGTDYNANNTVNYGVIDKLYITGLNGYDAAGHVGDITNVEQVYVTAGLGPVTFSHDSDPQTVTWLNGGTAPPTIYGHQIYVTDVFVNDTSARAAVASDSVSGGHYLGAQIIGSEFGDTITGGHGDDILTGNKGGDTLYGGDGNDTLQGGIGGDHVFGGAGDDTVIVYSGTEQQPDSTINGGDGTDTLFYNATLFTAATSIDITQATTSPGGTVISGFEVLNYQASNYGDTVHAGGGDDTLWGGSGDDFLFGGAGTNQLNGFGGTDTAVFQGHESDFSFSVLAPGVFEADNLVTGEHDKLISIENVQFDGGGTSHALSDYIH